MLNIDDHTDQLMSLAAFQYCLQRRSYIVDVCQEWTRKTWPEFTAQTQTLMIRDLAEALEHNTVGDELSVMSWRELLEWMRAHRMTQGAA